MLTLDEGIGMPEESTQPISYKCPNCRVSLESPAEFGGREDVCPRCGETCQVPMSKQQEAEQSLRRWRARREQAERRRMVRAREGATRRCEREARWAAGCRNCFLVRRSRGTSAARTWTWRSITAR